jgi:WD40 repeat protein
MSASASMSSGSLRRSPYQGLTPYSEDDAPYFFGREKEARLIVANLFASPLTLLYGASGVGKSSVLRAGVVHQLRKRDDLLVVVFNAWQHHPLTDLIQEISYRADLADHRAWSEAVRQLPQDRTPSLTDFLEICANKLERRLLIILDQFEEYFLYHSHNDEFGTEFPKAVKQSNAPVSFLISIREDFYAKLDRFEGRIPTLYDNYLRIEHLERAAARVAIEKPIEEYNRLHSSGPKRFSLEPELVQAVLRQVETGQVILGESGRGVVEATKPSEDDETQIETPYLQLVMTKLWDEEIAQRSGRLRLQTLNDLGGAENMVRCHLDAVMSGLLSQEQQIAARIFHYLVTPSGTKIAYSAADLAGSANLEEHEVVRVLEKLAHGDIRIIRPVDAPVDRPAAVRYEIFHDVLAPAILSWRTAYVQAQERDEAQRCAEEERRQAEEKVHAQARVAARLRRLSFALELVILLAVGCAVYAMTLRAKALGSERVAIAQADTARREKEEAARQTSFAIAKEEEAKDERKRADEQATIAVARAKDAERARTEADAQRLISVTERRRADQQAAVATSRELATAAAANLEVDPELSVLLGIEALSKLSQSSSQGLTVAETDEKEAKSVLHAAIQNSRVRLTLPFVNQSAESDLANSTDLRFAADGKRVVIVGSNGIATAWDAVTGTQAPALTEAIKRANLKLKGATLSPDGSWFAAEGFTGERSRVLLWDTATGDPVEVPLERRLGMLTRLSSIDHGKTLVLEGKVRHPNGESSVTVQLWDVATRRSGEFYELKTATPGLGGIELLTLSSDGKRILTSTGTEDAILWLAPASGTGEAAQIRILPTIGKPALSPTGKLVAGFDHNFELKVWDVDSGLEVHSLCSPRYGGCPGDFEKLAFSPDGNRLAGSDPGSGIVRVWDIASGRVLITTSGYSRNELALATTTFNLSYKPRTVQPPTFSFSDDGRLFAAYSGQGRVKVWSASSGTEYFSIAGHKGVVTSISLSPSGQRLITGSDDGTARVWDGSRSHEVFTISRLGEVDNVTYSPDGKRLAGSLKEGGVGVWDTTTWEKPYIVPFKTSAWGRCVTYSPDGKSLAVAADNGDVTLVDAASGKLIGSSFSLATGTVHEVAFSPDGKKLAAAAVNGAYVLDIQDRLLTKPTKFVDGSRVISVSFSPAPGKYVATGFEDGTAALWDARNYERLFTLKGHTEAVWRVAFSPDGKRVATASHDSLIKIWDVATGAQLQELSGHRDRVWGVAFSPLGKYLATTSSDLRTKIWDSKTGAELLTLSGHNQTINQAAFSPDESRLATCSDDGTIRIYTLDNKELIAIARARISPGRKLELDERKRYLHEVDKK